MGPLDAPHTATFWIIAYWMATSLVCVLLMFWDKLSAVKRRWRVPERTLLFWALIGGALGGKLGQRIYRHKTRKEPFRSWLNAWVVVNVLIYAILLTPQARDVVRAALLDVLLRMNA